MNRTSIHVLVWPVALMACLAVSPPAHAGYQTATFTFNKSSELPDGSYGTVTIESFTLIPEVSTEFNGLFHGQVRFTVEAFLLKCGEEVGVANFGIDKFAFNTDLDIDSASISVTDSGGTDLDWEVKYDRNISMFGVFSILLKGDGNSRANPIIVTISGLGDQATIDHFLYPSTPHNDNLPAYFAAHVGGMPCDPESHFIAVGPAAVVPAPPALGLAAAGLCVLGLARWRRHAAARR